jgi:hypothetical protein
MAMNNIRFFLDDDGYLVAESDDALHVLADFLSGDIQGSLFAAEDFIAECQKVIDGKVDSWEGTGNAHTVTIAKSGVEIFNEYTEKSLHIKDLAAFKAYLESWKQLIMQRDRQSS